MPGALSKILNHPLGRIVYQPFKAALQLSRRLLHPGIPLDHKITRVSFRNRRFSIEHGRWSGGFILDECFRDQQYELPDGKLGLLAEQLYRQIVDSGKKPLIVDCGANVGISVLWLTARYPEAEIVAIEPAPDNFAMLTKNCRGLEVDLRNAGIGAEDGSAFLDVAGRHNFDYQTNFEGKGLPTQILSMKTVLDSKPASAFTPFLLKVDIEGAEKFLFSTSHDLLNGFPIILMEPHDRFLPGEGSSLAFFRFHADHHREFTMNSKIIASVALHPRR